MGRLRDWWGRVTGRATPRVAAPAAPVEQVGARPAHRTPGELSLAETPPRQGAAKAHPSGGDPYSSDGGYAKPHSWERVDHD